MCTTQFSHLVEPPELYPDEVARTRPRMQFGQRPSRRSRKESLMNSAPHCSECGCELTPFANRPNSAFLILDRLSCAKCVKTVRKAQKDKKEQQKAEFNLAHPELMRPQTRQEREYYVRQRAIGISFKYGRERQIEKAKQMAADPHCYHCGRLLRNHGCLEEIPHLVRGRLSCAEHVKIVRAYAFLESPDSIVTESVESDADRQAREWNQYADRINSTFIASAGGSAN